MSVRSITTQIGALAWCAAVLLFPARSFGFSDNYPGWNAQHNAHISYAASVVQTGVSYYYKLRGTWPSTWIGVVSEGICQVPLYGYNMQVIDPDDNSLDFVSDVVYIPGDPGKKAKIVTQESVNGLATLYMDVEIPVTYVELFAGFDEQNREDGRERRFTPLLQDDRVMRRYAILGSISRALDSYFLLYEDYPHTWLAFLATGLSPIDQNSINPINGAKFWGDGRAVDFLYNYRPGDSERTPSYEIVPVNGDGSLPSFGFTY